MPKKFLFIDIETTGLDPDAHEIIELGAVLSDESFTPLAQFHTYVKPEESLSEWDPWSVEQHAKSGLLAKSVKGADSYDAIVELQRWCEKNGADKETYFAGSSIHFDISFLNARKSDFADWCEAVMCHRRLDLSVFRIMDQLTNANILPKNKDEMPHTALEDIAYDIEQARKIRNIWDSLGAAQASRQLGGNSPKQRSCVS